MDIHANMSVNLPSPPSLPPTGSAENKASDKEAGMKKASDDFATMLFAQMFSEMRSEATEGDEENLFGGGKDTDLFMNFFDTAVSQKYVSTGGNGVAEQLYQQLLKGKNPGA